MKDYRRVTTVCEYIVVILSLWLRNYIKDYWRSALKNSNWNKEHDYKWQWIAGGVFVVLLMLFGHEAEAKPYDFPFNDTVTMDVVKTNGGGGTWKCPSVRACYIRTLEAEARGANQYCESIVIKRNGKPVWWRKYR